MEGQEIPYGYCQCGCGEKTSLSNWTDKRIGTIKGQPYRYLNGHSTKVSIEKRFWRHVDKNNDCWEWTAHKILGYGIVGINRNKTKKAHRVSWELANGSIPQGLLVLHKCDNPGCVNPDHLFLGTQGDNMRDCSKKGRIRTNPQLGEKNHMAILNNKTVLEIREHAITMRQKAIAKMYGVSTMTINRVINHKLWRHI